MKTSIWIAVLNIALTFAAPLSAAEKGPDVDAILHKFVQSIGGREAWSKIESRQITAEMETMGAQVGFISPQCPGQHRRLRPIPPPEQVRKRRKS